MEILYGEGSTDVNIIRRRRRRSERIRRRGGRVVNY